MLKIDEQALLQMRIAGGRWAAYENQALDSLNRGHVQYLKFGESCTYKEPPVAYPADTGHGMGWRYRLVGEVNLEEACVESIS